MRGRLALTSRNMSANSSSSMNQNSMTGSIEKDEEVLKDMLYRIRECNYVPQKVRDSTMELS